MINRAHNAVKTTKCRGLLASWRITGFIQRTLLHEQCEVGSVANYTV